VRSGQDGEQRAWFVWGVAIRDGARAKIEDSQAFSGISCPLPNWNARGNASNRKTEHASGLRGEPTRPVG
jgi:hypothetical protein